MFDDRRRAAAHRDTIAGLGLARLPAPPAFPGRHQAATPPTPGGVGRSLQ